MKEFTIAVALIKDGNKYLIAKRSLGKKFAPGQWEFVSGFTEADEPASETIVREIQEELDVKAKVTDTSAPFRIADSEGNWTVIPFLVRLASPQVRINPIDHSEMRWVTKDELSDYPDLKPFLEGIRGLLETVE